MGQESVADGVKISGYDDSLGKNAMDAAKKAPVVGKGINTIANAAKNFGEAKDVGDVAAASGQLIQDGAGFVAGAAVDMATFVLDPVGWLVSNGLNMLLELVQPLQDALHFVTGDGPALSTASGNFTAIGNGFVALAEDFVQTGDDALKEWEGDAGDAARKALGEFSTGIQGVGSSAGAVAETLKMWSMVMTVIEEVVKAIISELVSALIYIWLPALAASVVSFGSSVAAAMATSVAKAASALGKITKHLGKLGKLLDKFMAFLIKWSDDLVKQGSTLTKIAGKSTYTTPGQGKAVAGAIAKASGTQGRATVDALGDVAKGIPGNVLGQTIGINPTSASQGSAYEGKAAFDMANKAVNNARDAGKAQEAGDIGGGQSAEETSENLDI